MALKDCKFYVDINGKQVEMDFDGFRAHLMQEGVMATLAPDLTKKRGKSAGFTLTARAEAPKAKAEAPAPLGTELTAENLRKLMPKLGKGRAEAIVALMKAMGIPFERIKLARGRVEDLPGGTLKQAQEKKKPKLVTAITGMTPQQAIEYFKKAKLIRPELAREILSKDVPEHLKPVAEFIFRQRQKFLDGKMTVRDVAKAYIITVSSIQAGAIGVDTIKASTGQTFPEYATMRGKKGDIQIRPEDAVSAWLLTPDGKKALDSLEQTGKVDEKLWQPLIDLRQAYGNNTLKTWAFSPESKGVNLHKIEEMTQLINQTGGNPRKLEAAVQRLVGIKDAKAGFIKHLLGFGDTPTVDAREINFWLTGQADISSLKTKGAEVARAAKDASGKVRQFVVKRIGNQIKDLAKQYDMDVNVGAHIVHHWLWDATSNEVTTHAVMMDAMELAQAEKASAPLGSIEFLDDLNALISVFEKANFSTVLHEGMHFYRRHMLNVENGFTPKQIKDFEDWAGAKNGVWSVAAEEKAARGFEKYLRDGIAPVPELKELFREVAKWMRQVYKTLRGSAVDIDIPPNIREVFDRIFTLEAERQGLGVKVQAGKGGMALQQADFTPAPDVLEAAKKWAGVREISPSVSSRLTEFYDEYNQVTDRIREALRGKPVSDIAGVLPNTEVFANVEQGLPEAKRANFKEWIGELVINLLSDGVPSFAIKGVAQSFGVSEADIKRLPELTDLVFPKVADVIPDTDLVDVGFEDLFIPTSPEVESKAGASLKDLSDKGTFKTGKPVLVQVYHGTGAEGIKGNEFSPSFTGTASNAESAEVGYFFSGTTVTAGRYASKAAEKSKWAAPPKVLKFFVKMRNPLVYDQEADALKGGFSVDAIDRAKAAGHDGVIITNTFDGGPLDSIFVILRGNENQIKSADPTTYDDTGKPIAMSERFQETPDIRYQKEGEAAPEGETATAAYRRAVEEQRREKAVKALQRLTSERQAWRKPITFAPAQPRPSIEITPVNRRAVIEAMEELRRFQRGLKARGVSIANASDAELDRWEKLLNRVEQLGGVNPITPQMDTEYSKIVRELLARYKSASARDLAKQALKDDKFMALHDKAATLAFGIPRVVPGSTHATADNFAVEKRLAAKVLGLDASKAEDVTWTQILLAVLKDTSPTGVFAGHRKAIFQVIQRSFHADEFVRKATTLSNWRRDFIDYIEDRLDRFTPERLQHLKRLKQYMLKAIHTRSTAAATVKFKTGEPALVSVYRGGDLRGGEFQEQFLGSFTKAPSARMGYFFAGRSETAINYSYNVQRYAVAMYNPFVYDYKGTVYREESLRNVIMDAWLDGHDGVIATNIYDPSPIDNVFVIPRGGENRIKTYGLAYDAKGKIIPLSERFNPLTKNVLYQGEDPLPNPEDTSTAAFRRKQAEERQKRLEAAMRKLREGAGKAETPKTEQAKAEGSKAAPKAEPKAAAPKAPPKAAQPKAPKQPASGQRRRGFGDKTIDEIFERLIERAEEGTLKSVPMSATEALESRIMNGLRKVVMAAYVDNRLDPSVADDALKAAKDILDAQQSGDQTEMNDAMNAFNEIVRKATVSKPETRKSDEERLREKEARVGQPKKVKSDEELVEAEINRYMGLFAERQSKLDAEIEIDGKKVSRREYLLKAMEDLRQAVKNKDILGQAKARRVIRTLVVLPPSPARPIKWTEVLSGVGWGKDAPRSPLSTLNIIGSYEAVAGELGRMVSEVFRTTLSLNAQGYYPSMGAALLDMEKQLEPLLVKLDEQGYRGMRPTIEAHVERIRQSFEGVGKLNKENLQKALESKQVGNIAAAVLKAFVYNTSLRFNPKSVLMNELQPLFTLWPFLTTREFVKIAIDARKPETIARVRDIAIKESGGRYEGIQPDERPKIDPFARSSERARIMGHLAGEMFAKRLNLVGPNRSRYISEWTAKVEFDNSAWNVPPLFSGPLKSTAFQFKAYTVKNLERFYYDWTRGVEGETSGKAARRAKMIIAQLGVGGVSSLLTLIPSGKNIAGVLILGYLAQGLSKALGDDEWGNKFAEAIYYGAPAFIGLDLSSSVGFLDEPFGETLAKQTLNFLTGPAIYKSVIAAEEVGKYFAEREKPAPLGRQSEKDERLERQGRKVFRAITPLARMGETAYDVVVKRKRPELYLDKEMPLTDTEVALRLAGGSPLRQTRFFDEKEAYDWQKKLLNRPVDIPGIERAKGEPESTYQLRVQRRQEYERRFLPQLQTAPAFQKLPKLEQDAVLDALQRNITEQAAMKKPDLRKLTPGYLLKARFAGAPERRERERKRLYNEPKEEK